MYAPSFPLILSPNNRGGLTGGLCPILSPVSLKTLDASQILTTTGRVTDMNAAEMKKNVCSAIEDSAETLISHVRWLEKNPEVGFREEKTSRYLSQFFEELGLTPETGLALTGVRASLKEAGSGPNLAVIGEMDALICKTHPTADPLTGAAHACGHHLQMGAMMGVALGLVRSGAGMELQGNVTFFGVPAEEYIDIGVRAKMREQGKIHFLGGKQELIYRGAFDDIDMAMMIHAEGHHPQPGLAVGDSSNGFIGKTIRYKGREAHAAAAPHEGINALNAAVLGLMGIHALRETFLDEDHVRVHPIITKGGDTVNSVPADVRLETYVRAKTMASIDATHHKVDRALRAGGDAVGAETEIRTIPGYLPLRCSGEMNDLFLRNGRTLIPGGEARNAGHFAASTDMGDLSHLIPSIHPFVGGVDGALHSEDFLVHDYHAAVILPAKAMAMTVIDLLANGAERGKQVIGQFKPALSREEYVATMDAYFS